VDDLNVKGHIITTDAMGTQTEIVKKIRKKHADYVLALKGNQGCLYEVPIPITSAGSRMEIGQ
jgi:predicted transposase YbfD/YdcC